MREGVLGLKTGDEVGCLHCEAKFVLADSDWKPFGSGGGSFECKECGAGEGDLRVGGWACDEEEENQ